jgi:DNA mismatch endonuclease (patch repair protein)
MARVRQKGTTAELLVRQVLSRINARYRLNVKGLPGRPDVANKSRKKAIFVHGCFWHHHVECGRGRIPTRNREFWTDKLSRNIERDARKIRDLDALGYDVLVLWECELDDRDLLEQRLRQYWFGVGGSTICTERVE